MGDKNVPTGLCPLCAVPLKKETAPISSQGSYYCPTCGRFHEKALAMAKARLKQIRGRWYEVSMHFVGTAKQDVDALLAYIDYLNDRMGDSAP